ncbi:MAG: hypothetical protein V7782_00570 [Psychromonas sp.]
MTAGVPTIDIRINDFLVYLQRSEDTDLPYPERQLSTKAVIETLHQKGDFSDTTGR